MFFGAKPHAASQSGRARTTRRSGRKRHQRAAEGPKFRASAAACRRGQTLPIIRMLIELIELME